MNNIALVLTFLGLLNTAQAASIPYTASTSQEVIYAAAVNAGIQYQPFYDTLNCESGLDPTVQSKFYKNGKREQSFGIAQINLPYHPDITKAEALDPVWSITWAAQQFKEGNANLWTCYRELKK